MLSKLQQAHALVTVWRRNRFLSAALYLFPVAVVLMALSHSAWAQGFPKIEFPNVSFNGKPMDQKAEVSSFLQLSFAITLLSLAPYILVMCTAFIRVTITLSFLRQAMGTQQVPPTQVVMGLGLFITMFVMAPVGQAMNEKALQPYMAGTITQPEFAVKFMAPLRAFMLAQTRAKDLTLFVHLSRLPKPAEGTRLKEDDLPFYVVCPAFVLSEVKTSFEIGFLLYIPFLVIDMIVSSVLMAMGMFMLSPTTISLPFKLLLFVMIDGWHIVINGLIRSFNTPKL